MTDADNGMTDNNGKKNGSWKIWVVIAILIALVIKNDHDQSLPANKQARLERAESLSNSGANMVYEGVFKDCLDKNPEDDAECYEWASDAKKESKKEFDQMFGIRHQ